MGKKIISTVLLLLTVATFLVVPKAISTSKNNSNDSSTSLSETSEPEVTTSNLTDESESEVTTKPAPDSSKADKNSPVTIHGELSVNGANIVDKNGDPFQLVGMSTHGIQWFPQFVDKAGFEFLRDNWKVNCIRLAMYTDDNSGYSENKEKLEQKMRDGIDYCIELGLYVIVDWHILSDGNPNTHKSDAIRFFKEIATEYASYPNIVYELCNEPNGNVSWDNDIKPYAEEVTAEIRKLDDNAVIIVGTPTWSQDIDKAESNRLSDKNTVYALHFYAATHTQWLRERLSKCVDAGLPVIVSEFGCCDASGNGGNNFSETKSWLDLLDSYNIGYINWNLADKNEASSVFQPNTSADSYWGDAKLTEGGEYISKWFKERD